MGKLGVVATCGNGVTSGALGFEEAAVLDPAGSYVVRDRLRPTAQQETWTLSCEQPEGVVRSARQVLVTRGQRRTLDLRTDCKVRR